MKSSPDELSVNSCQRLIAAIDHYGWGVVPHDVLRRPSASATMAPPTEWPRMIHTFERQQIDPNRLYGSIVAESESLILIHREDDFQFNGYQVIRRRDISKSY